jgi:hypothetical protein
MQAWLINESEIMWLKIIIMKANQSERKWRHQ